MADENPIQPAASPTGQPLVSSKLTPYFLAATAVCTAIAGASKIPGLNLPDSVFGYATLAAAVFGTLCGITPGLRKVVPVVLIGVALGIALSCTHRPPNLVITGDSLDVAGSAFEAVHVGLVAASDAHELTHGQALAWNDFFERWRAGYHGVAALWRIAKAKQDESAADQAGAILGGLLDELAQWQIVVLGLHPVSLTDGGSP